MRGRCTSVELTVDVWKAVIRLLRRSIVAPRKKDCKQIEHALDVSMGSVALDKIEKSLGED